MPSPTLLDDHKISLPCPKCKRKAVKTVGWVRRNRYFVCGCGTRVNLDSTGLDNAVCALDRQVSDVRRQFSNLNLNLNIKL